MGLLQVYFRKLVTELWSLIFCQNFVSGQYLENKLMEFDQILHMPLYWEDLGWDYYKSLFSQICNRDITLD